MPLQLQPSTPITIVSGLPRSGTSLMMQMLLAGGMPPMTDELRQPDRDNPNGYFEWEAIKSLARDNTIIAPDKIGARAVKVISTLLPRLPKAHDYKVIFMHRAIEEVTASQAKMLSTQGGEISSGEEVHNIGTSLKNHNDRVLHWLKTAEHMDVLIVEHSRLFKTPSREVRRIVSFLGGQALPTSDQMAAIIDPNLYRNRSSDRSWLTRLIGRRF